MTQDLKTLKTEVRDGVAVVTMARERVRNAFNESMIEELDAAFSELGSDPGVRVIVLAARGPAFCAGADLEWMARMADFSPQENRRDALQLARMLRAICECPKPTLARVHGDAYGGGLGLVAACDMAFAASGAAFCLSEARLGLIPATIGPYVVRAIGRRNALRYFQTAERFDSAEALRIGLVNGVFALEQLDAGIGQVLEALSQTSPQAAREAKRLVHDVAGQPLTDDVLADTAERIAAARGSKDGREGVQAFLQKRKPRWQVSPPSAPPAGDDDEEM
ncbi:MAG TPA: enoyl-CoA hydratase/isomerase family protein [Burkholderiaceae bacterium]|jgi:methylglutaconyl-CoA hydratase|nr:enoyl-CoA hydratase/isomerase family protein [Burkholderiaceae bacterium]